MLNFAFEESHLEFKPVDAGGLFGFLSDLVFELFSGARENRLFGLSIDVLRAVGLGVNLLRSDIKREVFGRDLDLCDVDTLFAFVFIQAGTRGLKMIFDGTELIPK
jgi:hypothetical protein